MAFAYKNAAHAVDVSTGGKREQVFTGLVSRSSIPEPARPVKSGPGPGGLGYAQARRLAAAVEEAGIDLGKAKDKRARALFLMRGFYLLGVLRGGEVARAVLLDEEAEGGRFVLSRACALLFLKELSGLSSFLLEANCKAIGL